MHNNYYDSAVQYCISYTGNFPPNITGLQRIMVQSNESKTFLYLITDDTDERSDITLSLNDEVRIWNYMYSFIVSLSHLMNIIIFRLL